MTVGSVASVLIAMGVALAVTGLVLWAGGRLGFGHLPGDFTWGRGHLRIYAPLATSLVVSAAATLVLNLLLRR